MRHRGLLVFTIALIAALLASSILLILTTGGGAFTSQGRSWEGLSDLKEHLGDQGYEVVSLISSSSLLLSEDDPEGTIFMSLGPERAYTLTEKHAISSFHERGGRLVLADDTGNMDPLAKRFEVGFPSGQLYDENFQTNPSFVRVDVNLADQFSGTLLLNEPSYLIHSGGRVIASTGGSAWVDRNGNGMRDLGNTTQEEPLGEKTVAVVMDPDFLTLESGCAVFLSDPSLFLNEMLDQEDNMDFITSLISYLLPDGGKIVIDDSVHQMDGAVSPIQRGIWGMVFMLSDVNMKIIIGSMTIIMISAMAYLFDPPERLGHTCLLDRTGLAELAELNLTREDVSEIKKTFLDRVRVKSSISVEDFSKLDWFEVRRMINDDRLYRFVRSDRGYSVEQLERILVEVSRWGGLAFSPGRPWGTAASPLPFSYSLWSSPRGFSS